MKQQITQWGIILVFFMLALAPTVPVHGAVLETSGTVAFMRSHDIAHGANADWFAIVGLTSLGSCGASDGFVVFRIKDDARGQRHFAMLLAAKSAGVSVTVSVDDTVRDAGGYCFVRWIS